MVVEDVVCNEPQYDRCGGTYHLHLDSTALIVTQGAIIAQIAITALSLPYLEQTHWTVQASFVVSLVAGLLSVYYACMIQLELSNLQGPKQVKQWLTTHRSAGMRQRPMFRRGISPALDIPEPHLASTIKLQIPSYGSALLLAAPSQLLNWSLTSLLVGIGIYYGLVYSEDLGALRG